MNFSYFSLKKGQKNKFQDPEFVTTNNKNAIETPHRFIEKVKFLGSIAPKKSAEIAIDVLGGF